MKTKEAKARTAQKKDPKFPGGRNLLLRLRQTPNDLLIEMEKELHRDGTTIIQWAIAPYFTGDSHSQPGGRVKADHEPSHPLVRRDCIPGKFGARSAGKNGYKKTLMPTLALILVLLLSGFVSACGSGGE